MNGPQPTAPLPDMLAVLRNDFSSLGSLIKSATSPSQCHGGNVTIRPHYLPFRNGAPMTGELLDIVRAYICNFAMSRAEIERVHQKAASCSFQERMIAYNKLRDDAADLFIKAQKCTGRNGECGELLLYLLTEWILDAPQILAKMSLKTNAQMPIHGSDGIHVKYDERNDGLIFFWGEAKLHKTISGAMKSAVDSITATLRYGKLKEDINLVRRYVSLSGLPSEAQDRILDFLDPLHNDYTKKTDASVCLIGFDFNAFRKLGSVPTAEVETVFLNLLTEEITRAEGELEQLLKTEGITHHRMEVFFLPLSSVESLRVEFQNRIGWKS